MSFPLNESLVIIPTYNERENVAQIIEAVFSLPRPFDVLIIDDNSPDGTADIVKELQDAYRGLYLLEREGKLGLGTAYITGFEHALAHGYQYVFEMDADFSHNPRDLVQLLNACKEDGYDMAIGSRLHQRSQRRQLAHGSRTHVLLCQLVCEIDHRTTD